MSGRVRSARLVQTNRPELRIQLIEPIDQMAQPIEYGGIGDDWRDAVPLRDGRKCREAHGEGHRRRRQRRMPQVPADRLQQRCVSTTEGSRRRRCGRDVQGRLEHLERFEHGLDAHLARVDDAGSGAKRVERHGRPGVVLHRARHAQARTDTRSENGRTRDRDATRDRTQTRRRLIADTAMHSSAWSWTASAATS